jgi:hypothetical protein
MPLFKKRVDRLQINADWSVWQRPDLVLLLYSKGRLLKVRFLRFFKAEVIEYSHTCLSRLRFQALSYSHTPLCTPFVFFLLVCNFTKKLASYFSQEKEKGLGADSFIGDSMETRQRNSTIACNVKKTPVE